MGVTLFRGLHDELRPQAALLYWQAFGGKLGRVLGPKSRALLYLERVIRSDLCYSAVTSRGELIGIAGYRLAFGSFAGGTWSDLTAVYGPLGGQIRGRLLRLLVRDENEDEGFLIEGICVAERHRSRGIGSMLLAALYREAAERGYRAIRLDVVESNHRAIALYQRQGFQPLRTDRMGLLRLVFGFAASTAMIRPLD